MARQCILSVWFPAVPGTHLVVASFVSDMRLETDLLFSVDVGRNDWRMMRKLTVQDCTCRVTY